MASKVYMMDFRANPKENLYSKLAKLLEAAGLPKAVGERDLVAVKLHFGEMGNTAFIRPVFIRQIVGMVKATGGIPFLTDANTLYAGTRSDSPTHIKTAVENGFGYSTVEAPIIIADGLRGRSETAVEVNHKHCKEVYIGSEIVNSDFIISAAHFKGHELSGFGGAIKNLGMGCASRRGKLVQHSGVAPKVVRKKCVGCGDCLSHCSQKAITVTDKKASINKDTCIGCGECILICQEEAINIAWSKSIPTFLKKMIEYTAGVVKGKEKKLININFLTDINPACDCYAHNDAPLVRDIGILASVDPIAIDQASTDLVNQEHALPGCSLTANQEAGGDKFKGLYPYVDWPLQLEYAESLGIGSRTYDLVKIG